MANTPALAHAHGHMPQISRHLTSVNVEDSARTQAMCTFSQLSASSPCMPTPLPPFAASRESRSAKSWFMRSKLRALDTVWIICSQFLTASCAAERMRQLAAPRDGMRWRHRSFSSYSSSSSLHESVCVDQISFLSNRGDHTHSRRHGQKKSDLPAYLRRHRTLPPSFRLGRIP
jgi:hypothetical protein